MNGGLNYQIEHHLFPRMNHCHYPTVAPVVRYFCSTMCTLHVGCNEEGICRQFCEEKGIPYVHFSSISENVSSTARHLFDMGHNEKPKKVKIT